LPTTLRASLLKYGELNDILKRYCKNAGILYRSSHKMRKTYISKMIDGDVNINTIREQVGHRSEQTTYQSYCYDRSTDEEKRIQNQ